MTLVSPASSREAFTFSLSNWKQNVAHKFIIYRTRALSNAMLTRLSVVISI